MSSRTIDGNGDALRENIAISSDEGRDLGELVVLEELSARLAGVGLDNLEVEVVGLRNSEDGRGPRVGLEKASSVCRLHLHSVPAAGQAYLVCVELSERHDDGLICWKDMFGRRDGQIKFGREAFEVGGEISDVGRLEGLA